MTKDDVLLSSNGVSEPAVIRAVVDELAKVFSDSESARLLATRSGFPREHLPQFVTALGFWTLVITDMLGGRRADGVRAVVDEAARQFPANPLFAGWRGEVGPAEGQGVASGTRGTRKQAAASGAKLSGGSAGKAAAARPRVGTRKPIETARPVTWLHLSDMHMEDVDKWDRDLVLSEVVELVRRERPQRSPDFIVVTGDIAQSGRAEQYAKASVFFERLLDAAGLGKQRERLVVVPGNHDVDRKLTRGLARTLGSEEESGEYFGPDHPRQHFGAQAAFRAWHDELFASVGRKAATDSTVGARVDLDIRGTRVAILPVNTALFARDEGDRDKLWVGHRALREPALALQRANAHLRIVAMHHPIDWLSPVERRIVRQTLRDAADLILTGHLHEPDAAYVADGSTAVIQIAAGATYQSSKYPRKLFYGTLEGGAVRLRPYKYGGEATHWVLDTEVFSRSLGYEEVIPLPGRIGSHVEVGGEAAKVRRRTQAKSGIGVAHASGTAVATKDERPAVSGPLAEHAAAAWDAVLETTRILEGGPLGFVEALERALRGSSDGPGTPVQRVAAAIGALGHGPPATLRLLLGCYGAMPAKATPSEAREAKALVRRVLEQWIPHRHDDGTLVAPLVLPRADPVKGVRDLAVLTGNPIVADGIVGREDGKHLDVETRQETSRDGGRVRSIRGRRQLPLPPACSAEIGDPQRMVDELARAISSRYPDQHDDTALGRREFTAAHLEFLGQPGPAHDPQYVAIKSGDVPLPLLVALKESYPWLRVVELRGARGSEERKIVQYLIYFLQDDPT